MSERSSWTVKGVGQQARTIARAKAHQAGLTIGEWLEQAVRQAPEGGNAGGEQAATDRSVAELAARMQHLEARLAALTTVVEQSSQEIERSLASGFAELERRLPATPPPALPALPARPVLDDALPERPRTLNFQPVPRRRPGRAIVGAVVALAAGLGVVGYHYANDRAQGPVAPAVATKSKGPAAQEAERLARLEPSAGDAAEAAKVKPENDSPLVRDMREAEGGSPEAMYRLGRRYAEAEGAKADPQLAVHWLEAAAREGHQQARIDLARLYSGKAGVESNPEKALAWLTRAADAGDAPSQYALGLRYASGDGAATSFRQAATWFRRAAEQGHVDAQYNLGMLYWRGVGVERDVHAAHDWLSRAAAQGDSEAARRQAEVALLLVPGEVAATALSAKVVDAAEPPAELPKLPEVVVAPQPVVPPIMPAATAVTAAAVGDDEDVAPPAPLRRPEAIALRSQEARIRRAQELLRQLGYDVGEPDGVLGPRTKEALASFGGAGDWHEGGITPVLLQRLSRAGSFRTAGSERE